MEEELVSKREFIYLKAQVYLIGSVVFLLGAEIYILKGQTISPFGFQRTFDQQFIAGKYFQPTVLNESWVNVHADQLSGIRFLPDAPPRKEVPVPARLGEF